MPPANQPRKAADRRQRAIKRCALLRKQSRFTLAQALADRPNTCLNLLARIALEALYGGIHPKPRALSAAPHRMQHASSLANQAYASGLHSEHHAPDNPKLLTQTVSTASRRRAAASATQPSRRPIPQSSDCFYNRRLMRSSCQPRIQDHRCALLGNHQRGRVGVARRDHGHHRRIGDS